MANRSSRGWIKAAVGPSVLERAEVIGDSSADFIKASGHVNRANRPDTWAHPTAVPIVRISLHHGEFPCITGAVHTWTPLVGPPRAVLRLGLAHSGNPRFPLTRDNPLQHSPDMGRTSRSRLKFCDSIASRSAP